MINNKSSVNFYLIALEFILFATSQITFLRDCEVKFILLWHSKLNKRNWQKKASSSYFWCKANIVKHIREPLIDRNTILMEHPLQSTNYPYDIVANCICTMLVSSIRRFSSFLSNYQVINLPLALRGNPQKREKNVTRSARFPLPTKVWARNKRVYRGIGRKIKLKT